MSDLFDRKKAQKMRLIDADALIEKFEGYMRTLAASNTTSSSIAFNALQLATDIVIDADEIDAEHVRHGQWVIKRTGAYKATQSWCSVCGKRSGIGGINQCKPYCPNCGAKMDAEG